MHKIVLVLFFLCLISCNSDDDICTDGEGTPQMKLKFKTNGTGKPMTMDSIFVDVDYGNGIVPVIERRMLTDSILVPLKVDDSGFTEIYVGTSQKGVKSKIRVDYIDESQYVSPACGIRKFYKNVTYNLFNVSPVLNIESGQNEIVNENKTHLYLLF